MEIQSLLSAGKARGRGRGKAWEGEGEEKLEGKEGGEQDATSVDQEC